MTHCPDACQQRPPGERTVIVCLVDCGQTVHTILLFLRYTVRLTQQHARAPGELLVCQDGCRHRMHGRGGWGPSAPAVTITRTEAAKAARAAAIQNSDLTEALMIHSFSGRRVGRALSSLTFTAVLCQPLQVLIPASRAACISGSTGRGRDSIQRRQGHGMGIRCVAYSRAGT